MPRDLFSHPIPPGHQECPTCSGDGYVSDEQLRRMVEDRPGQVGRNHPDTSRTAARQPSNVLRFGTQRYKVLLTLAQVGPETAAEVSVRVGLSRNQCATRLGELREVGFVTYVRDDDSQIVTRPTGPNDEGQVQTITPAGLAAMRQVKR